MLFTAEFPAGIDSKELYNNLQSYNLNVTDVIVAVYVNGQVDSFNIHTIIDICLKFGVEAFQITKRAGR